MSFNIDVTKYIQGATAEQIIMLDKLRQMIHEAVPGTSEAMKWSFPVFASTEDFAYLRFSKNHVTLGFYHINKIADPDDLLEGSGSKLRHLKIKEEKDIDAELIKKWLVSVSS